MLLIESSDQLQDFLKKGIADNEKFIAVDTEFIRENLKEPLLCLIQIATTSDIFIIDPIVVDIAPLNKIFENTSLTKVFHSAGQDLEILSFVGINTKNFYDTQLYEAVLSVNANISYQSIVFRYLNKEISKTLTRSNWKKRPLQKKQLLYSANDVFYLREVYEKQLEKLTTYGRRNWLDDELKQLFSKENEVPVALSKNNLEIYNQLNKWREEKALEKNISPEFIVKNHLIKAICQKGVNFIRNIKNSRNVRNAHFREFLFFAEKVAEKLEIKERSAEQNTVINLLLMLREMCSLEHNVAPSIIATSRDLENLAAGDRNVKCL
ncbi:MAG: HRDC domain-containing protein, partial [Holosporaceae bacterium]|nr:HRDC domain-containing protein [Holosporaceae bacterium]